MRAPYFWPLYLACAAAVLATALAAGVWAHYSGVADAVARSQADLDRESAALVQVARPLLAASADESALERFRQYVAPLSDRVTVVRADGRVVFDSLHDARALENHGSRPEIRDALRASIGRSQRTSATSGAESLYVARAIDAPEGVLGVLRVARLGADAYPPDRRAWLALALSVAATSVIMLLFANTVARRIRAPLEATADLAEAIARGDYRHPTSRHDAPEIRRLSEAIESMTAQLEHRLEMMTVDRNKVLAILSSMVEGVVAVDQDERVVHLNTVASKLLDADPASALGRRVWEVTRVSAVREILDRTRASGEICSVECTIASDSQSASGAVIEMRAAPLRDGSGAVLVLHDVTALRKLENIRRDFVANVSHELKTPLTAIRAMVETMIDDREMPEETLRRFLDRIRDQAGRLTTLVSDLLTLARIESSTVATERRMLDARSIVRECAARAAAACEKKQIKFTVDIPAEPVLASADDESLRQIVDNLLDNACKYTASSGSIWLGLRSDDEGLRIDVRDSGIGIDPRDRERVFERFYRVDKARSRELGGTGLGLSIVKHLVQSLGGRVSLQSELGKGSLFQVRLPSAPVGEANPTPED